MQGTLCKGEKQGTFAQKFHNFKGCQFYIQVREEEGAGLELSAAILGGLKAAS